MLSEAGLLFGEAIVRRSSDAKLCMPGEACHSAVMCSSMCSGLCSEGTDLCRSLQTNVRGSDSFSFSRRLIGHQSINSRATLLIVSHSRT